MDANRDAHSDAHTGNDAMNEATIRKSNSVKSLLLYSKNRFGKKRRPG